MLYPQDNECREVKDLSGVWRFRCDFDGEGLTSGWHAKALDPTIPMPVPASYNDITQDAKIRDHVGWVWYETSFFVPISWLYKKIFLHFGSVSHHASVWINGEKAGDHKGGFLPFRFEVTPQIWFDRENRLTVAVSNMLDYSCLPPGEIRETRDDMHPPGFKAQEYFHDFFNYAGIHRPVKLLALAQNRIESISVTTEIADSRGIVNYDVTTTTDPAGAGGQFEVRLLDREGKMVLSGNHGQGTFVVPNAVFWEPGRPYLYTLVVRLIDKSGKASDCYRQRVGIRTVKVVGKKFFLNAKPFYFKGCSRHEDADIRGKGFDWPTSVKDSNLLKWLNANSFRTSHYPYAEEILDLADEEGFCVIDELPAVGLNNWNEAVPLFTDGKIDAKTLEHHCQVLAELIARDRNHPSVVMWSVANEPGTFHEAAFPYFKKVIDEAKRLDPTRPVTLVESTDPAKTKVSKLVDVVCINRYYAWYYPEPGRLDLIETQMSAELDKWWEIFKKPVLVTEFGADTIAGMHSDPPAMFSEEFQTEFMRSYANVFDKKDYLVGEHVWVFADFATKQGVTRVMGNRKGVFTRQRQPKSAAFFLKERWKNR